METHLPKITRPSKVHTLTHTLEANEPPSTSYTTFLQLNHREGMMRAQPYCSYTRRHQASRYLSSENTRAEAGQRRRRPSSE